MAGRLLRSEIPGVPANRILYAHCQHTVTMGVVSMTRRDLLSTPLLFAPRSRRVTTVQGEIPPSRLGVTLIHEHILVDFAGADQIVPGRYNRQHVIETALPRLMEAYQHGCRTFVDCTPAWLGRDPSLLRELSRRTGMHFVTNTGYYGANKDRHLPKHAFAESPEELGARWIAEAGNGVDGTRIRPGFVKLGVDRGRLSEIDRKLIVAGAICHLKTGLRLHVHTGPGSGALDILDELRRRGVHGSAYVWVHAQNEIDRKLHIEAAKAGAWLEFDGVNAKTMEAHLTAIREVTDAGFLDRLLVSQDSGWYHVGEPAGGTFNGYTFLFDSFLPALRAEGFSERQIKALMVSNPASVLAR
jgi:predicted metal-dependent phosphotriesterase family hydrolase